jgi:hypothetical protein
VLRQVARGPAALFGVTGRQLPDQAGAVARVLARHHFAQRVVLVGLSQGHGSVLLVIS